MQEKQLVQRCRECGRVHVSGSWRHATSHEDDWILVDAYCPSCFLGVRGAVIHMRGITDRLHARPATAGMTICGSPQVV
jgi:hypothetical protein